VKLTLEQKAELIELIEAWADRVSITELPAVVWDLRCSLADDLHVANQPR
jgi:predicted methyltransferase